MKERIAKVTLAAALLLVAPGMFSITLGGPGGPLADRVDAVIVKGKALPASMLGALKGRYRLFAQRGSGLVPVPYQIDERDPKGEILMRRGPKAAVDSDKGAFDANDELVFMAFDTGGKAPGKPAISGCGTFAEIAVSDVKKGVTGYVYLAKCSSPPAASSKKYARWDPAKRLAITDRYKMGWREEKFHYHYYDYLSLFGGPDILDRVKIRIAVGFKRLHLVFKEDSFKPDVLGYISGPVRAVLYNKAVLKLGIVGRIPAPMCVYWYRDYIHIHNLLDNSVNPASVGLDYQVRILHDLKVDRAKGYKICANMIPDCMAVTGKMTPEMDKIVKKELRWGGFQGPDGAIISRLVMDPKLYTRSIAFYLDDDNAKRKPEYIRGSAPEMGFFVVDWKKAVKGIRYLDFYHYVMKKYSKAQVMRYSRITKNPLKKKARAM